MKCRIAQLLVLILAISFPSWGQRHGQMVIEVSGSSFANSARLFYDNGNEKFYGEGRLGIKINKHFETSLAIGHQERSFIYYAQVGPNLYPLFMERHYIPVSMNLRLYLSDFFYEKLKLWKKQGRWDVYNQVGLARLFGHDVADANEETYRQQGAYVPYYLFPYVRDYGKLYITYIAGVRYNFNSHLGLFLEGGEGMIATLQIGLSGRF